MSERVAALARRVEDDPFFLAHALAAYARANDLSDDQLAARLGCAPDQLPALRLCRKPRGEPKAFQADVGRIAAAFQVDVMVIAEAVRMADALRTIGQADEGDGFLMAARDRDAAEADDTPEEIDRS